MSDLHLSNTSARKLQSIGYSWFISKLYHDLIDPDHTSWNKVDSARRVNIYAKSEPFYKSWVYYIANCSGSKLSNNSFGLGSDEVLTMANSLLDVM